MKQGFKKALKITVTVFLALNLAVIAGVVILLLITPVINDRIAFETENELKNIPLPTDTEIIETKNVAGKLIGNGNGMQYLAVMLIESELSIGELKEGYSAYGCRVKKQEGRRIEIDEYKELSFDSDIEGDGYYLVYMWGKGGGIFAELDLRGH